MKKILITMITSFALAQTAFASCPEADKVNGWIQGAASYAEFVTAAGGSAKVEQFATSGNYHERNKNGAQKGWEDLRNFTAQHPLSFRREHKDENTCVYMTKDSLKEEVHVVLKK